MTHKTKEREQLELMYKKKKQMAANEAHRRVHLFNELLTEREYNILRRRLDKLRGI